MIDTTSIEQAVARGHFVINPHGVSMWPMIRNGKDSVLIEPVDGRLSKYDIPLYKDRLGRYVIHRIIEVTDTGYIICGDGLFEKEYDITDANIIGIVAGFFRKEKFIPCTSKGYMFYVKLWVGLMFVRKPIIVTVRKCRILRNYINIAFTRLKNGEPLIRKKKK
ncbi:MAG: S24/S26 family peptidase [Ruminococcus sp.]|nr:S24/S26 family peptidase [Ruminococcus sp.]